MAIIEIIDAGETVICDWCNVDYTGKSDRGGFLFQSKATCPGCALKLERDAKRYGEERLIRARCPEGMAFSAWVLSLRGGDNSIRMYTGDDFNDRFFGRR